MDFPGMKECPSCGKQLQEFKHESSIPFPHTDLTYRCSCGFWSHITIHNGEIVSCSISPSNKKPIGIALEGGIDNLDKYR